MQNDSRDWNIAYHSANNVAGELLKQLKRDVPFESVSDLMADHAQIHSKLMENYREFNNSLVNGVPPTTSAPVVAPITTGTPVVTPTTVVTPAAEPVAAPTPVATTPPITPSTPESVKTAINMAIDSANTAEELNSIKDRVLKATKIDLEDQAAFISKVDEKIGRLPH